LFSILDFIENLHGADKVVELPQYEEHGLEHDVPLPENELRAQIGQTPR